MKWFSLIAVVGLVIALAVQLQGNKKSGKAFEPVNP
jgi:hypothetical protein